MANQELAKIFYEISQMLSADKVDFKPYAYRKAAMALESLDEEVSEIYKRGGIKLIEKLPGVGESIGKKIEQYIKGGRVPYYEKLKKRLPVDWNEITAVQGVGPKRAKLLYENLGIRNLADLEKAARSHKIAILEGFGNKSEENILQGIEFKKKSKGRFLRGEIKPKADNIKKNLENSGFFAKIDFAGSLRRGKETIGDIDVLAALPAGAGDEQAKQAMDFFAKMPGVEKIWGQGLTKSSVRLDGGFNMDIRIVNAGSYGAALQYFTGSKEHNISLRKIAQEKGLKLSEYGLFRGEKMIAGREEKEIYEKLGLDWIPPEMRENRGEIEAAAARRLPNILGYDSLMGDLHCHSDWDGGHNSVEEFAIEAMARGYFYVGIADHTKFLKIEKGLDEARLAKRNWEIDKLNEKLKKEGKDFLILKGCEANILGDGTIDIADEALADLDFAIAGVHSGFGMDKQQMTSRIIRAMENKNIDIISHPTGRLLNKRREYDIDFEAICEAARRTGTVLEINSFPDRLDLDDWHIMTALKYGVKLVINTDSHQTSQMKFADLGISQARRGWAEAKDIINTYPLAKLLSLIKN